jgi:hypothetical protein
MRIGREGQGSMYLKPHKRQRLEVPHTLMISSLEGVPLLARPAVGTQ